MRHLGWFVICSDKIPNVKYTAQKCAPPPPPPHDQVPYTQAEQENKL